MCVNQIFFATVASFQASQEAKATLVFSLLPCKLCCTHINCSSVSRQGLGGSHVSHNARYAHIDTRHVISILQRRCKAQKTPQPFLKHRFASYKCSQGVRDFAQFNCPNWQNGHAVNTKNALRMLI